MARGEIWGCFRLGIYPPEAHSLVGETRWHRAKEGNGKRPRVLCTPKWMSPSPSWSALGLGFWDWAGQGERQVDAAVLVGK